MQRLRAVCFEKAPQAGIIFSCMVRGTCFFFFFFVMKFFSGGRFDENFESGSTFQSVRGVGECGLSASLRVSSRS